MTRWLAWLRYNLINLALQVILVLNRVLTKLGYRRVFYAEFWTDRHLRDQFFPDFTYSGVMVEVGCATPYLLSMSQHFRQNGWRCIGIEPNPNFVRLHRQLNHEVYPYAASNFEGDEVDFVVVESSENYSHYNLSAHSYSALAIKEGYEQYNQNALQWLPQKKIQVSVRRLSQILETHCPEVGQIDLLSVDVEGFELEVMQGLDLKRHPVRVVVLENLFYDQAYTTYMESQGYRLHSNVKYNYIYVRQEQ